MTALNLTSVVSRASDLITTEVDREIIILKPDTGDCYGFNRIGSTIWNLMPEPRAIGSICADLMKIYAVDHETCAQQVLEFFNEFRGTGLMLVQDAGGHRTAW